MIQIVWEFVARDEARGQFELAYGPGGAWSRLFARSSGYRGTTLLRDANNPCRYLALDFWDTEAQRAQVLTQHKSELDDLDASLADWTDSQAQVGVFNMLAEATVRPRLGRGRSRSSEARRRRLSSG